MKEHQWQFPSKSNYAEEAALSGVHVNDSACRIVLRARSDATPPRQQLPACVQSDLRCARGSAGYLPLEQTDCRRRIENV